MISSCVARAALAGTVLMLAACTGSPSTSESGPRSSPRPTAEPILATGPPAIPGQPADFPVEPGQSVAWGHCGIFPIRFDGLRWKVQGGPINAPSTFSGFGELERRGSELHYRDDKGLRLTFVPWDGRPDRQICA